MPTKPKELDGFRDHCGVVGIYGHPEAAKLTYLALYALQHRGQDSAGIVSIDEQGKYHRQVGSGLVADVFNEEVLQALPGSKAIGHVRYTTAGTSGLVDAQPILVKTGAGPLSLAHNGNLVRAEKQRFDLEQQGAIFQTSSDTEVICHLFARRHESDFAQRLLGALTEVQGAFSICALGDNHLVGVRDPYGVRPLVLGKLRTGFIIASEDCAFDLVEAERVRDILPGEMVLIGPQGITSYFLPPAKQAPCIFEHVYFARPDSNIFGGSVHATRKALGQQLAREAPVAADAVIAVPDSGVIAAMGYAAASGIPFESGLVRNHYVGRTFIEPQSGIRHFGVRLKLSPVKEVVRGRRLIVVDDSIVRGTTSRKIVAMLKAAGAKEIHMRICAPPTRHPCFYGIDTPSRSELIASTKSVEEITQYLGVNSLAYLSVEGLHRAASIQSPCDACFTGKYPIAATI